MKPSRRAAILQIAALCVMLIYVVWSRHGHELIILTILLAVQIGVGLRAPSVVAGDGITRPWRRPRVIQWSQVDSVAAPEPAQQGCKLNLTTGKRLSLADIPADQSPLIAKIGHKPLAPPTARPTSPERPKNDAERAAEVSRQVQALAAQWRQLAAESQRLRDRRSPSMPD